MSKELYIISDIHSFYKPLIKALNQAGYDKNNPEHVLVVCGDVFDRGQDTIEVFEFLKSIPKENLKMIRGNHEQLFIDLLKKRLPDSYDFTNGTVRTFCHIAGVDEAELDYRNLLGDCFDKDKRIALHAKILADWREVVKKVWNSEITEWLMSDEWLNYYETDNEIFVHSWIPKKEDKLQLFYFKDWRAASQILWESAMWGNPFMLAEAGLNQTGKFIIFGHFHTSYPRALKSICSEFDKDADFSIYKDNKLKIIGLDSCTAYTNKINVLKITSEGYFDGCGNKLV